MVLGKPAPFVSAFVAAVDDALAGRVSSTPHDVRHAAGLAGLCVTAVLVTNSMCWARL